MVPTENEALELLDATAAAKLVGTDRHHIVSAMNSYKASNGKVGLAFIVMPTCRRRRIRRLSLRKWFESLERSACYV